MAEIILKDAVVTVNGTALSNKVRSVTINYSAEIQDTTAMGDDSRTRLAGLKDWNAEIEFYQDFDAAAVDATLFPLVGAAAFPITIRADSAAISATNPSFNGNVLLESYPPLGAAVGEVVMTTISLPGDGDLTRATA